MAHGATWLMAAHGWGLLDNKTTGHPAAPAAVTFTLTPPPSQTLGTFTPSLTLAARTAAD